MDNLRGLLDIRRMDRVQNAQIRELCGVVKGVDKRIDEVVLRGSVMWRKWRMIGLRKGSMYDSVLVVPQWIGRGRSGLIPRTF